MQSRARPLLETVQCGRQRRWDRADCPWVLTDCGLSQTDAPCDSAEAHWRQTDCRWDWTDGRSECNLRSRGTRGRAKPLGSRDIAFGYRVFIVEKVEAMRTGYRA